MIKRFLKGLDQKYLKICMYAAITVLVTVIAGALAFSTGPFWSKLWAIFTAVLKPIIIGGIICYLLLPVVNRLERLFNRDKEHGWARSVSVLLTFAVIAAAVILVLAMIVISIYKNVGALNIESITNLYTILKEEYAEVAKYLEQVMESFNISSGRISTILKSAAGAIENFFSGLLFGVIFAVYFLLDKKNSIVSYWNRAFRLIFGDKAQEQLRFFMKDADNAFSGYIRGQMVDAAIVGVMASIALAVAGVPYAVLIGVSIGFGNLIPSDPVFRTGRGLRSSCDRVSHFGKLHQDAHRFSDHRGHNVCRRKHYQSQAFVGECRCSPPFGSRGTAWRRRTGRHCRHADRRTHSRAFETAV